MPEPVVSYLCGDKIFLISRRGIFFEQTHSKMYFPSGKSCLGRCCNENFVKGSLCAPQARKFWSHRPPRLDFSLKNPHSSTSQTRFSWRKIHFGRDLAQKISRLRRGKIYFISPFKSLNILAFGDTPPPPQGVYSQGYPGGHVFKIFTSLWGNLW